MRTFSLKLSNQIAHLRANMVVRSFPLKLSYQTIFFFFGEDGDAPLVEDGDPYSTAVDDEYDLEPVYE